MELSKLEIDLIYPTFWGSIKENGIIHSGNGIIQSGNGIIQTGNGIISLIPDHWSNNFFYKMFLNFINEVKAEFENRK